MERERPALYEMEFVLIGYSKDEKDVLKNKITKLGGKVGTKIGDNVMAVIATKDTVEKKGSRIQEAESCQVHVVSEDFIDEAPKNTGKIPDLVISKSLCNWGSDVSRKTLIKNKVFYFTC